MRTASPNPLQYLEIEAPDTLAVEDGDLRALGPGLARRLRRNTPGG
jgi:hypothetical protein